MKSWLVGKDPDMGKVEGNRRRGQQRMRWLDSITDSMDINLSKVWETVKDQGALRAADHGVAKNQTWLSNNNICIHRSFSSRAICKKSGKPLLLDGSMINLGKPRRLVVKNLLARARGVGVSDSIPGLGRSLEEEMATHSSNLAWRISWTEEPGGLHSIWSPRVDTIKHETLSKFYGQCEKQSFWSQTAS